MKRWLGIDFSGAVQRWGPKTRTSNVWIADVREGGSLPVLWRLDRVQSWAGGEPPFEWLIQFLRDEQYAACSIDAPFSVPARFLRHGGHRGLLDLVCSIPRGRRPFPRAQEFAVAVHGLGPHREPKPLRATEEHWRALLLNVRSTLWAGPRGSAAMTAACLTLLGEVGRPIWPFQPSDRDRLLAEAFPMAQLRQWGLPYESYGGSTDLHRDNRRRIIATLSQCINLGGYREHLEASADAIDAVLCAFAALAVTEDRLAVPVPDGPVARTEGWIAVHDGHPSQVSADRIPFIEAVERGAEAARRGDLIPHSEALRLLESFGR